MALFRRAGAQILNLIRQAADPAAIAGQVQIYSLDVLGVTQVLARAGDGSIYQLTPLSAVTTGAPALFGDGSDGAVTLPAGPTTLTRDMFYDTLVVPVGSTLLPDGYRVYVKTLLTLNGVISRTGNPGADATFFAGGAGGTPFNSSRPLGSNAPGGPGSVGAASPGGNIASGPPLPGPVSTGGNGGDSTSLGGVGGTTARLPASDGGSQMALWAISGRASLASPIINCGPGGGGGAGVAGAGGGGGGAGGGYLVVSANEIIGTGSITSNGGLGGNAFNSAGLAAGGGGGGGGGVIVLVINKGVFPTATVVGGVGGLPGALGTAGQTGTVGMVQRFNINT